VTYSSSFLSTNGPTVLLLSLFLSFCYISYNPYAFSILTSLLFNKDIFLGGRTDIDRGIEEIGSTAIEAELGGLS
jgi:hypothetical protein